MFPSPRAVRFYGLTILFVTVGLYLITRHPSISPSINSHLPSFSKFKWSNNRLDDREKANALLSGKTVAIYDYEQFHEEVHGSILWTFNQFDDNLKVKFYRPGWRWQFAAVIESWWTEQPLPPTQFWEDLESSSSDIRYVFIPTIDFEGRDWKDIQPKLRAIWNARQPEERFTIIGLRHWGAYDLTQESLWWAERDALSFLTLGDHVTNHLRGNKAWNAGHYPNAEDKEALERIRVETYIPAFPPDVSDMDDFGNTGAGGSGVEGLNKALVQSGNFDTGHRAMKPLFDELRDDVVADPELWGYKLDEESGEYLPIDEKSPHRFTLKILGLTGTGWPDELKHVVSMENYLPYKPYYDRIHDADIVLPAFGDTPYGVSRASSTMGVAATARTPLAVTESVAEAYGWFCPAFARIRENNMTEIEYIRQVRLGNIPWKSKDTLQDELEQCQYDWTTRNMLTVAKLFATAPEGSDARERYFGPGAEVILSEEEKVEGEKQGEEASEAEKEIENIQAAEILVPVE